jgi:carboxymethylenebutenolidase
MHGQKRTIQAPGGSFEAYVAHPDGAGPWPAVLFFHDGFGLRPTLHQMADRLAGMGCFVIQPNMYWRAGAYKPFEPAKVFAGPGPEMDRLMALITAMSEAEVTSDTEACFDFLGREPMVEGRRYGVVGYCLGGGLTLGTACRFPDRVAFAASLHGGGLVVEDRAPALVRENVKCEVYIGVAEIDRRHTAETSARLEEALSAAGVPHQIELYAGAAHGWCVPDLPPYNEAAAERHWARLEELVRRNLG